MKQNLLLGAIIGDTIGSIYEFDPTKDYNFRLFDENMDYTDDTVMTIAVAYWLQHNSDNTFFSYNRLILSLKEWGNKYRYPKGSYGNMFSKWLDSEDPKPYNSWGNGSAMRVSPIGFSFQTLEETLSAAHQSAEVTHNHPEGIKGAQATAAAIFLARIGKSKSEIRDYISSSFGYDLSRTCDEIRPTYQFEASCQKTVPEAIIAFLDSKDFEDAIRLTISLGGDADTMGAITGAIAAAYYKSIPEEMYNFVWNKLPDDMKKVINQQPNSDTIGRFLIPQETQYQTALNEIKAGKKVGHWIWYIFPQLKGLGYSYNSEYYGIVDVGEAKAYIAHPILGARLLEITTALLENNNGLSPKSIYDILGPIDSKKVQSCMTLFEAITHEPIFTQVLDTMYAGKRDNITLKKITNK